MNVHLGAIEDKMITGDEKEQLKAQLEEEQDKLEVELKRESLK